MSFLPATPALLNSIGGGELVIVLLVVLLLFGGDKMPQLAKGIGKAMREFRRAASDVEAEFKRAIDEVPDTPPAKPAPSHSIPTTPKALEAPRPPADDAPAP